MKLVGIIRSLVLEYIEDDADLIFYDTVDDIDVEFWKSEHTEEFRGLKKRIPESKIFMKLAQDSISPIVNKYFKSGKQFRNISMDDPKKIRFAVRRIKGQSRPQMILQVEVLTDNKIVLNVITNLDTGQDLYGINDTNRVRFILDLGAKDLVGK